jgi:hypothetical protein
MSQKGFDENEAAGPTEQVRRRPPIRGGALAVDPFAERAVGVDEPTNAVGTHVLPSRETGFRSGDEFRANTFTHTAFLEAANDRRRGAWGLRATRVVVT